MIQIAVITPVPDVIDTLIQNSMLRKAVEKRAVELHTVNLREFGIGNYRQIDDTPFGGGSGMVMMAIPLFKALDHATDLVGGADDIRVVYPSPQGKTWDQKSAEDMSQQKKIIMICGHYKGIDERVIEKYVTDEYSIGDFVMTSGEIPAMVMLDSIVRLVPGTLNTLDSALSDTFTQGLWIILIIHSLEWLKKCLSQKYCLVGITKKLNPGGRIKERDGPKIKDRISGENILK